MSGKDRFFSMAQVYDKLAPKTVPGYHFLQDEIFNIITFEQETEITLIDLGGGSGILLEKILNYFPNSSGFWIDYSDDFLKIAKKRLSKFNSRITFILSQIEEDWETKISNRPNLIVSSSAIHHLIKKDKKLLYQKCYDQLKPGGWFINIDEMKSFFNDAYMKSMKYWYDYVLKTKGTLGELEKYYDDWMLYFEKWKQRNINNVNVPKIKGDDIHESFEMQVNWLKEIGFEYTDLYIKYYLWCLIGGMKPI